MKKFLEVGVTNLTEEEANLPYITTARVSGDGALAMSTVGYSYNMEVAGSYLTQKEAEQAVSSYDIVE